MNKGKIAVIGDKDLILAFKAIGMDVFSANNSLEAEKLIKKIEGDYAIIFITENLVEELTDVIEKYKSQAYPAIIPIPSSNGSTGFGEKGIKMDVEKAIGTDILFGGKDE